MPSATDNPVDRVRKFRAKTIEHGGASLSVMLKPGDDATMWKRLVFEHGGPTPALRYLLRLAMDRADRAPTDHELMQMLAARLRAGELASAVLAGRIGQESPNEAVRPKPKKTGKTPTKSS